MDRLIQEWAAIVDFIGSRPVLWRGAMTDARNDTATKFKAVIQRRGLSLGRESSLMQGAIQPITASVAREHAAGSIGAMCTWRKTDDQ
jgi:hypothetical protein